MKKQCIPSNTDGQATDGSIGAGETEISQRVGPWLVELVAPAGPEKQRRLRVGERVTIGSRADADLRVDDPIVSGRHCLLEATGKGLRLVDLDSKTGVFVGAARIDSAMLVREPASFTIGNTRVLVRRPSQLADETRDIIDGLEGRSEPMVRLKRDIHRVARLRAPVLITGESGVGKDVVARALHRLSGRLGAYVPINVSTISENLAESELFGHQRGAFTGAIQASTGAFEHAHQGTLFLDEIGELSPVVQAKMLRILEDGVVRPIGACSERRVDVRVVSATWANLPERCASGRFRFDLFQRLSVLIIAVPPLRERRSDIPLLVEYWLRRHFEEVGSRTLTKEALELLSSHDWPGNVRELGGTIYRACVSSDSDCIDRQTVERAILTEPIRRGRASGDPREYLARAAGNVAAAARLAGLPRTTYRTWLRRARAAEEAEPQH